MGGDDPDSMELVSPIYFRTVPAEGEPSTSVVPTAVALSRTPGGLRCAISAPGGENPSVRKVGCLTCVMAAGESHGIETRLRGGVYGMIAVKTETGGGRDGLLPTVRVGSVEQVARPAEDYAGRDVRVVLPLDPDGFVVRKADAGSVRVISDVLVAS